MARTRNKKYKQGDRINIYVSRDVTPEFIDWINKQSDLSNFFLYAALKLYESTGPIDVAEIMPRKIDFSLSNSASNKRSEKSAKDPEPNHRPELQDAQDEKIFEDNKKKDSVWFSIEDFDDPFA